MVKFDWNIINDGFKEPLKWGSHAGGIYIFFWGNKLYLIFMTWDVTLGLSRGQPSNEHSTVESTIDVGKLDTMAENNRAKKGVTQEKKTKIILV